MTEFLNSFQHGKSALMLRGKMLKNGTSVGEIVIFII
jgi:hypothetical protein